MSDPRPIGIFDSGMGGLTVVKEILRIMPGEAVTYLGDTARVPYGGRSEETIRMFARQDAQFLLAQDIKMLVVACNTVSAVALDDVRELAKEVPVIGVVLPGAKAAVLRTAERRIGVIGTTATIRAESYRAAIRHIDSSVDVYGRACPLFVPLVEEGLLDSDITRLVAQRYLYELVDMGIDCLILGCTHYPLLFEVIQETVGNRIQLVDSALWTAKEAQDILSALEALSPQSAGGLGRSSFHVTDLGPSFQENASIFMGAKLPNARKVALDHLAQGAG